MIKKMLLLFTLLFSFSFIDVKALDNIEIEDIIIKENSENLLEDDISFENNIINNEINFNDVDDYILLEVTLKNNNEKDLIINSINDNNIFNNLLIEYEYDDLIKANSENKIAIKISYNKKLINIENINLDNLAISFELKKNNKKNNLNNIFNIIRYSILVIIVILIIVLFYFKKNNKKLFISLFAIMFVLIIIPTPFKENNKNNLKLKFNNVNIKGELEIYYISIDSLNGNEVINKKIIYGDMVGNLPDVSKFGYDFIDWIDQDDNVITSDTIVTKPLEIKAKFKPIKYSIEYDLSECFAINKSEYNIETETFEISNPVRNGYTFVGWLDTSDNNIKQNIIIEKGSTGNRKFIANFVPNMDTPYKVIHKTMNLDGKNYSTRDENVFYGQTDSDVTPNINSYEGFTSPEQKTIKVVGDGTAVVEYLYKRNKYSLVLGDENNIETSTKTGNYYYGSNITLKAKKVDGYIFDHWSNGSTDNPYTFTLTGDTNISPEYRIDGYNVSFDSQGGTSVNQMLVMKNTKIGSLPETSRNHYSFEGWYTNPTSGNRVTENTIISADVTFYAHWSYVSSDEIVEFNILNGAMNEYFGYIRYYRYDQGTYQNMMYNNFVGNGCSCSENTCQTGGSVQCDKPIGYNTGFREPLNVYLSNYYTKEKIMQVGYTLSSNGVIYNMIPGQTYYWELASNPSIYGYIYANGNRRVINASSVRNVRDLGGLQVDIDNNGTIDGVTYYGRLFRGVRITGDSNTTNLFNVLGITEELDLRASSERRSDEPVFLYLVNIEAKHYFIDYNNNNSNYNMTRNAVRQAMIDIVSGHNIFFHCRIGTDRTGTVAYILEGLLGVSDEDKIVDYELSYFYGLVDRTIYYVNSSGTGNFGVLYDTLSSNEKIYEWYMAGSADIDADNTLISNFRNAMIYYY